MNLPTPEPVIAPKVAGESQTGVTPLTSISDSQNPTPQIWGSDINDAHSLPVTAGVWLQISNKDNVYIGDFDGEKFSTLYQLSAAVRNIHLFSTEAIMYTLSSNKADSVIGIANLSPTTLFTAPINQTITSVYFEPFTKSEYIALGDGTGSEIELQKPRSDALTIYTTNQFPQIQITDVNADQKYLAFTELSSSKCFHLNLLTKAVNGVACAKPEVFNLPEAAALPIYYTLVSAVQLKDGKLVAIVTDLNSVQQLVTETDSGWQPMEIPECGASCTYQFLN